MHGPKNNLNLLITIESVKAGADATVLYRMSRHFSHIGILFIYDRDSDYFWYSVRTYKKTAYTGYMY